MQIGDTVSFSLAADGADLAVDLEVSKEKPGMSSPTAEVRLQSIQEKAAKPSSLAKQPTRKLQRGITRFHNAGLEERLEMIEAAEGLLGDLMKEAELDGDAICKLLCRCAGWLHAPGSFEAKHVAATEVAATQAAPVSQPRDLQHRVRRLLISALRSLDLSDSTTYQAVETAVLYILQLMQGKETFFSGNGKSLAVRQWQLRELVADNAHHGPKGKHQTHKTRLLEVCQSIRRGLLTANERPNEPSCSVEMLPVHRTQQNQLVFETAQNWTNLRLGSPQRTSDLQEDAGEEMSVDFCRWLRHSPGRL